MQDSSLDIQKKRLWKTSAIVTFLILWEMVYYVGFIDPVRFSHPSAVLKIIADLTFIEAFSYIIILSAVSTFAGGALGVFIGEIIIRVQSWTLGIVGFLRVARWLPFLIYGALPFWSPQTGSSAHRLYWILTINVCAVTLYACYCYLIGQFNAELKPRERRLRVLRASADQAVLISLFSQFWMPKSVSLIAFQFAEVAALYATFILLGIFLFMLEHACGLNFDLITSERGKDLLRGLSTSNWRTLRQASLLSLLCLAVWEVLGLVGFSSIISSPLEAAGEASQLLFGGADNPNINHSLWADINISLLEMLFGLILAGIGATLISSWLHRFPKFRNVANSMLSLLQPLVILVYLIFVYWITYSPSLLAVLRPVFFLLQTIILIALLCFPPFVKTFWGLRKQPLSLRIILSSHEALPFAFLGMIFGQTIGSVQGIAVFILAARLYTNDVKQGFAAAMIMVVLFVAISLILSWIAKHIYNSSSRGQAEVTASAASGLD